MNIKRWFVIRHIRYWYLSCRVHSWARFCYLMGLSGFSIPNESDSKHLQDIWEGHA